MQQNFMKQNSILDNVIYLDIETTGLDIYSSEIIEIGAVKVKDSIISEYTTLIKPKKEVPTSIYYLCEGLKREEILNAREMKDIKREVLEFLEDLPLICHNGSFEKSFLNEYIPEIKNEILDSMELAAILEPGRKSFNLQELMNDITELNKKEIHRGLQDSKDTMAVVNALLCRLWEEEERIVGKENLHKTLKKLFQKNYKWTWTKYLERPPMFSFENYDYVVFGEKKEDEKKYDDIKVDYSKFEELLREADIWNNGGDINYQYRKDQENLSQKIRENIEKEQRIFIEAPTGSGKTFAYLLIAAIMAYENLGNRNKENASYIISTDTKELQNQLIDRDIPNILRKLNLHKKIKFGAMKGKGNYICIERLVKTKEFEEHEDGLLAYTFLFRLCKDGKYGDLENINYWAVRHFNLHKYISSVNCESENCSLDKCRKPCYLRNRYNNLPQDNITVINHSLLASWPYAEKKPVVHLILDEAHNLMEKAYDFFTEEFNSKEFLELLKEIDAVHGSMLFLLDRLNTQYGSRVYIDKNAIKEKQRQVEYEIYNLLNELRESKIIKGEYNFTEEFFNAEDNYKEFMESLKEPLSSLKRTIFSLFKEIDNYIKEIVFEEENETGNEYKTLISFTGKIKLAFDVMDTFITETKEYAKIFEIDKNYNYLVIKNTPINIGQLINENILKEVKSTTFLSATLRINNSFNNIKRILGQEKAGDFTIPAVFDLKNKTRIFNAKDIGSYTNNEKFIKNSADLIFNMCNKLGGHILVLFNNNLRRESVKNELLELTKGTSVEIFDSKKAIPYLLEEDRQIIILGSKGFFEGIDVPGDALNCVIMDKIPNISPTDPLFKALREYTGIHYGSYNYPKICIKMKQSYGRLIRSTFDYGYFIILDGGTNNATLNSLEKDLGGPRIESRSNKYIYDVVEDDYQRWRRKNLSEILNEVNKESFSEDFKNRARKNNQFWRISENNEREVVFKNKNYTVALRWKNKE